MRSLALFLIGESIHHRTPRVVRSDEGQFSQQAHLSLTWQTPLEMDLNIILFMHFFRFDNYLKIFWSRSNIFNIWWQISYGGNSSEVLNFFLMKSANPAISPPKLFISRVNLFRTFRDNPNKHFFLLDLGFGNKSKSAVSKKCASSIHLKS